MTFYQILSKTCSLLFVNTNVSLGFIKLCAHDFSRVSFAIVRYDRANTTNITADE